MPKLLDWISFPRMALASNDFFGPETSLVFMPKGGSRDRPGDRGAVSRFRPWAPQARPRQGNSHNAPVGLADPRCVRSGLDPERTGY
jgi:hypothetical protein